MIANILFNNNVLNFGDILYFLRAYDVTVRVDDNCWSIKVKRRLKVVDESLPI